MTPILIPFLVRVRIPDLNPPDQGASCLYIALCRGRYNVEKLMAKHGDAKLLYLLDTLTNCPKPQSTNIYDRCNIRRSTKG
jgi:hypothetical protein